MRCCTRILTVEQTPASLNTVCPFASRWEKHMPELVRSDRPPPVPSRLVMCDRLLRLAQDAGRAGFDITAEHLFNLAHAVLEEKLRATH